MEAPEEGSWAIGNTKIEESHFKTARNAEFNLVRIPIGFSHHCLSDSPFTINTVFMDRVEQVVKWGLNQDLRIIN